MAKKRTTSVDDNPSDAKETTWLVAPNFKDSWKQFKSDPTIRAAMKTFNDCKRERPPLPLPAGMRDHKLTGSLNAFWECHLAGDVLLIYKPLAKGVIKLLRVCTHDEIRGPRGKTLAQSLKGE